MKRFVFALNTRRRFAPRFRLSDVRVFFKRYGAAAFFSAALFFGIAAGASTSGEMSSDSLRRLDFLFLANMPERLGSGFIGAFAASLSSDFIFSAAAFLCAFSAWGVLALPLIAFFKGFGTGVTAGYVISAYGFRGAVFYVAVLLPGIVLFSLTLVNQLASSYNITRVFAVTLFRDNRLDRSAIRSYLFKSLKYLLLTVAAAVLDTVLWLVLSGVIISDQ